MRQRKREHLIVVEIGPPSSDNEIFYSFGCLDHVANASLVVRLHIELRRSARPRRGNSD
jgi:hypothetical protein